MEWLSLNLTLPAVSVTPDNAGQLPLFLDRTSWFAYLSDHAFFKVVTPKTGEVAVNTERKG